MSPTLPLFPEQASTLARDVDLLYGFMVAVSLFFAVLIAVLVTGFAIKYRRRSEDEVGADIHGSLALELFWTIIPFGIALVMFGWGAKVYLDIARPPDDAMEVFVVGKQWMWKLQHMEGRREINQLHVPVGKPVRLTITSEDVIHSFYVPAFRVKMDAVPGRYTQMWFEATKPGTYHLFCAEYCGTEHSKMIGQVIAMEPAAYQEWLAEEIVLPVVTGAAATAASGNGGAASPESMVKAGENLFVQKGCLACHMSVPGSLGPDLAGVFGSERTFQDGSTAIADEAYLREAILNPMSRVVAGYQPVMPTFQGQISEPELLQIIQYIRSLAAPEAPEAAEASEAESMAAGADTEAAADARGES